MPKHLWTDEELRILRARYPDERAAEVAKILGRPVGQIYQAAERYGLHKSDSFKASDLSARIQRGKQSPAMISTRFQQHHIPHNKGIHFHAGGRSVATQFKSGEMRGAAQHNYVPIGTERISKDGYLERKVTDDHPVPARRWVGVHRIVWEVAHGPIPPGHVVVFRAGRRTADAELITDDALELVTRIELMRRNSVHQLPPEVAAVVQLRGALTRQINIKKRAEAESRA